MKYKIKTIANTKNYEEKVFINTFVNKNSVIEKKV